VASPRSDRWFLALWLVVALAAALSRKGFIGDGVKHVTVIMA